MLTLIKKWLYDAIVRSGILYRFLPTLGTWYHRYITTFYAMDHVADDSGNTMRVVKWNGRNVSLFTYERYDTIKDIKIRKDDLILCSFPKTGCHWVYEILYMLRNGKPELSRCGKFLEGMIEAMPDIFLDSVPSPRILNSHVLYEELPTGVKKHKNKIVLTIRCPKDSAVSFFHHIKNLSGRYNYGGNFKDYFTMFMRGDMYYGDYFDTYVSWDKAMREGPNQIFLVSYESMKENPVKTIMELANFLDIDISQEFAEKVTDAASFSKLKEKTKSPLIRKGVVGDWKTLLTDEQSEQMNAAWKEKMLGLELLSGTKPYCT